MTVEAKPGSVVVAYLHPGEVAHSFHESWDRLRTYDSANDRRLLGRIAEECGAGRIVGGRNNAVRQFLTMGAEWLVFIDADMGFAPDTVDRLIDAADPTERPIVGGLAFAQRKGPESGLGARRFDHVPTLYRWVDQENIAGVSPITNYPRDALVQVDATGAACLLIHRSVLEHMGATTPEPQPWFAETVYKGQAFGEDITFCRRAVELGYPIYVHTGIQTSHYKAHYLTEETVKLNTESPTFVVIPVKGRMDLTESLLRELVSQGGYEAIFVVDNGSPKAMRNWLATQDIAEVLPGEGLNIHQMWNLGIAEAVKRAWPCNIAILNNDLKVGPDFLSGLATALRSDSQLGVVSPNYDGREGSGVQLVDEICANRYDGTGGLAGFAFMLRGESGYKFPEELTWWYGDNHLLANVILSGSSAAIALDVECEHIDGGSQTARWDDPEVAAVLADDRRWFEGWVNRTHNVPESHVFVLWSGARNRDKILADIRQRFSVVDVIEQTWDDFPARLAEFYDQDVTTKLETCGSGPFTTIIVEAPAEYGRRETTRGSRMVNTATFDMKQVYRQVAGNIEAVHASDTAEEAAANLGVLHPGFASVEDALAAIPCAYVALRDYVGAADVDLLVEKLDQTVKALGGHKVDPERHRVRYAVRVAGEWVPFDLRYVGDGYYPHDWERDILARRELVDGVYRPSADDWYWSLLYHAVCHKPVNHYSDQLEAMRPGGDHTRTALAGWLAEQGYGFVVPTDTTVPLVGVINGEVTSGFGAAAGDVERGIYGGLGDLYPGTLNLRSTSPALLSPAKVAKVVNMSDGRRLMLWAAKVGGVDCYVMAGGHSANTLELLAPVRLRDALDVEDGDAVRVVLT